MLVPFFAAFYPTFFLQSSKRTLFPRASCLSFFCFFVFLLCLYNHLLYVLLIHLLCGISCISVIFPSYQLLAWYKFVLKVWSWAAVMMASAPFLLPRSAIALVLLLSFPWRFFSVSPIPLLSCIVFWYSSLSPCLRRYFPLLLPFTLVLLLFACIHSGFLVLPVHIL